MNQPFKEIETSRLLLREINPEISKSIFNQSDLKNQMSFFGVSTENELYEFKDRFQNRFISNKQWSFKNWLLFEKSSGLLIGDGGFHLWALPHKRVEVGYALNSDKHKQKGYMTEALSKMIEIAFNEMGIFRIEAFIGPDNIASLKLIEKFGFQREAYMKQRYWYKEELTDLIAYALFKTDFRTWKPTALSSLERQINRFEKHTLPAREWTHEAHLTTGLWYLYYNDYGAALCKIRSGIISYNLAVGTPNTLDRGYHETLTLFWTWVLDQYLKRQDLKKGIELLAAEFLKSPYADKYLPFQFYTKKCLMSTEARGRWLAPDIQSLDFSIIKNGQ